MVSDLLNGFAASPLLTRVEGVRESFEVFRGLKDFNVFRKRGLNVTKSLLNLVESNVLIEFFVSNPSSLHVIDLLSEKAHLLSEGEVLLLVESGHKVKGSQKNG